MEEYTVIKKGTEDIFYVLRLPEDIEGILANIETGALFKVSTDEFILQYEFNGLIDDESESSME